MIHAPEHTGGAATTAAAPRRHAGTPRPVWRLTGEMMTRQTGPARQKDPTSDWQIARYVDGDSGEPLYAVVRRGRRHACGLHSRAAAERWLSRMQVPVQQTLKLDAAS